MKALSLILIIIAVFYVGVTVSLFRFAVFRKKPERKGGKSRKTGSPFRSRKSDTDSETVFSSAPFQRLTVTSFDGLTLTSLYLPAEAPRGTLILFHGFHSSPKNDFSESFPFFSTLGYNLLFPIQRTHGESEGKFITYGIKERYDAVLWAKTADKINAGQLPIYVGGISMGSTTALMGAGVGYPENVRGIIADCGFISPHGIFTEVMQKSGLPPAPFVWLFGILCRKIADFDIKDYSTLEAIKHTDIPIAFIHGEKDRLIHCKATIKVYSEYTGKKHLLTVKNALHGDSYVNGKAEYEAVLRLILGK